MRIAEGDRVRVVSIMSPSCGQSGVVRSIQPGWPTLYWLAMESGRREGYPEISLRKEEAHDELAEEGIHAAQTIQLAE